MIPINPREAQTAGYHALTIAYQLPCEQALLKNVLADLRRGNIDHVLVKEPAGVSVWRRGNNRNGL